MDLKNTPALVTGASRGLGRALAEQLARAGARVVLVARSEPELTRVADAIRSTGGEAHALIADVSRKEDVYPLAGAAAGLVGPIDLLIHNASSLGPTPLRLLLDTECEDVSSVLETNVVGPFRLSKAALDHLSRVWAAELAERGIRVLSVDPGEMDTLMHQHAMPDADPATLA